MILLAGLLHSAPATSIWDGIYTKDQAGRGQTIYRKACASCHGDALEGKGQAPPLSGSDFKSNWNGQSVGALFDKMQDSMPADQPGSLKPQENADILSYLLQMNSFPAGSSELPAGSAALQNIRFEAVKPNP